MQLKTEIEAPLKNVKIEGGFWGKLMERNCKTTLPHVFQQCEKEGHIRNISIAAGQCDDAYTGGADRDSDLFKVMEGWAYCLELYPDEEMESRLDDLIALISTIQEPDGYLQSYITSQKPEERYEDLQRSHELYCAGHLMEAAVAHYHSTGKQSFLQIAVRLADHVDNNFGPGKMESAPGHQEIELALVRLYKVTEEKRYLNLSRYFVDARGNKERVEREYGGLLIVEDDRTPGRNRPPEYRQDHHPILEQRFATGHAVRAGYLYAALTDIAMEFNSDEHASAAEAIWENIVTKKLYISGGVGTHQYHDEGYGDNYVLPNTGYCETCGGIAFMLFSYRMGLLKGHSKYADVVELILYNHFLSSIDISGCNTFYRNPLSSQGPRKRQPWNHPACCPTNVVRIIPQFPRYMYSTDCNKLYIDHFAESTAKIKLEEGNLQVTQKTDYPWNGKIEITITSENEFECPLHIRIPGWIDGNPVSGDLYHSNEKGEVSIRLNENLIDASEREAGYVVIRRIWKSEDLLEIEFSMPIKRVYANLKVGADRERVALMRGPLLYCLEENDIGMDPEDFNLSRATELVASNESDLLGGITVITDSEEAFRAMPFSFWNNRGPGKMAVWIKEE